MRSRLVLPLHRATHEIAVWLDALRRDLPISQAEVHVLAFLDEREGDAGLAELHRSFGHKRSTLTSIVDRLEGRHLLRRAIDPDDRRSFRLVLTAPGQRLGRRVTRALEGLEAAASRRVTAQDLAGFTAVLAALEDATGVGPRPRSPRTRRTAAAPRRRRTRSR